VAEDHQTKNARALSDKNAAIFVADKDARAKLVDEAIKLVSDKAHIASLETEVKNLDDDDYVVKYARDHYIFTEGDEKAVILPEKNHKK
jgi:UDP-N-acetylglucosamine:LPS N-acetylglucosamine transferase